MENEDSKVPSQDTTMRVPSGVTLLEATLVIIVIFFLSLVLSGGLYFLNNAAAALVVGELLFLLVPLFYLLFKRINVKSYVKADLRIEYLLLGIGFGILLLFANIAVSFLLTAIFGPSQAIEESNRLISEISSTPTGLIAVIASLSLAGVCEEFAFRGFLQRAVNQKYSFLPSAVIAAAIFGIFHFDPQLVYILSTFTLGLILGIVYHRWNYVVCAAAHSTMNIIVLVALLSTL